MYKITDPTKLTNFIRSVVTEANFKWVDPEVVALNSWQPFIVYVYKWQADNNQTLFSIWQIHLPNGLVNYIFSDVINGLQRLGEDELKSRKLDIAIWYGTALFNMDIVTAMKVILKI